MADFNQAIQKTLKNEGGYQNNPKDWRNWKDGKSQRAHYFQILAVDKQAAAEFLAQYCLGTKYGITSQDMPGVDIRSITAEQATAYYREHYWKALYSQMTNQPLTEKLFDMGVLFGVGTAVKMLQISLSEGISVVSDGIFGEKTLASANDHGNLEQYRIVLYNHAMAIVNQNPEDAEFLHGWTVRIQS